MNYCYTSPEGQKTIKSLEEKLESETVGFDYRKIVVQYLSRGYQGYQGDARMIFAKGKQNA
jgi:hypothetical protein